MKNQRGAVAVVVGILMVSLVGFTAIAVDVGSLWMDRKELQNGADAAALALAQSCAGGACEADENSMADSYAAGNKRDANVAVTGITHGSNSVTVDVLSTRAHWFAPVIGHDASDVTASATASWGGIGAARVLPLTVSECQLAAIQASTVASPVKIYNKASPNNDDVNPCDSISPPTELAGGFGWLVPDEECMSNTDLNFNADSKTGISVPSEDACSVMLADLVGSEILLPIFDDEGDTGSNAWFHLMGYVRLQVTEYCFDNKLNGSADGTKPAKCPADRWISGHYLEWVALDAVGGGPDFGATTVYLSD